MIKTAYSPNSCGTHFPLARRQGLIVLVLACWLGVASAAPCPAVVRIGLPDFPVPPLLYGDTQLQTPPGDLVTWTRAALADAGCTPEVRIQRLPLKRLAAELKSKLLDIAPGLGPAAISDTGLVFPMRDNQVDSGLMIVRDRLWLYVRAEDQHIQWDGSRLNLQNPHIGISAGMSATSAAAQQHGWFSDIAKNPEANLRKLYARRIDAILESELWLDDTLNAGARARPGIRKLEPLVASIERYAPVTPEFYRRYPDYTRRFWSAIHQRARATYRLSGDGKYERRKQP